MPVLDTSRAIEDRVRAIRSYHDDVGTTRAELDVSGGVDSAVMLGLLASALGPDNVTAVYTGISSSPQSLERASAAAEKFAVRLVRLDLTDLVQRINDTVADALRDAGHPLDEIVARVAADRTIEGSFRSCLRAPVGRYLNRLTGGGIRHGTGNECEDRWLRFYQKGGDGEVDTNPIAMMSKGETFQLAIALGVPREILVALPSPDLWGNGDQHNDEDELLRISGVEWTYSRVDPDSGHYVRVGTIERLSRFLDHNFSAWFDSCCGINGAWLFANYQGVDEISGSWTFDMDALVREAIPFFPGHGAEHVRDFLASAKKWERATRHKMNPNCPALGSRRELVEAGILTNTLPEV